MSASETPSHPPARPPSSQPALAEMRRPPSPPPSSFARPPPRTHPVGRSRTRSLRRRQDNHFGTAKTGLGGRGGVFLEVGVIFGAAKTNGLLLSGPGAAPAAGVLGRPIERGEDEESGTKWRSRGGSGPRRGRAGEAGGRLRSFCCVAAAGERLSNCPAFPGDCCPELRKALELSDRDQLAPLR